MKGGFRWKLMGSYLLLVLLLGAGLYLYLAASQETSMTQGTRQHLEDEARIASLMAQKEIRDLKQDAPALTRALSKAIRSRVTVIAGDGVVVADSDLTPGEWEKLENHGGRPEVRQALKEGIGSAIRYSATLHTDMLYVAASFGNQGVVRLALPLSELEQAKERLRRSLGAALAVAVLASLLLSYFLSNLNSRNLRRLATGAHRIGRGEFGARITVQSQDEMGELAQVLNEMSGRIEQQLELISSEKNQLDAILNGMGEGVMVTDPDAVVTLVNPAFCAMFATSAQVQGRPLLEITRHPDLYAACREALSERQERHQEIALAGGKTVLVHWVPLKEGARLQGAVAVFHDITAFKRVEKIRRDFVANVSHELRTPVTVIKGYAETLLSGALAADPQRAERFLQIIQNHADRLSGLVRDLLTLSELESGEMGMQLKPVALDDAIRQALLLVGQRGEEKGVELEQPAGEAGLTVQADRGRLEQVLINLLDNAIKYSEAGSSVSVETAQEGDLVRVSVRDSGIGIPEKDLPRLFERFYRVDEARSRDNGGTGLGLSIVKHIVQAHGGTLEVKSTQGKGSVFSFTLPLKQ
ncbi:Phosphate regulon sensor protein PhoR [Citrifermentans bremense]|uniref:histidine kinase n=1 Tax=Citrifermentans bremense TaxID=60035 RepID=A0A6S6M3F3_9BACT|nr:ATP-binding protein [Citrifermentans bremense]BCG46486.1 Phosphate regulon sensor protein PhoR [Citrifermentans bremense]